MSIILGKSPYTDDSPILRIAVPLEVPPYCLALHRTLQSIEPEVAFFFSNTFSSVMIEDFVESYI